MDSEDCLGIVRLLIDLVNCFPDLGILGDRLLCLTVIPVSVFAVFVSLFRVDLNGLLHEIVRSCCVGCSFHFCLTLCFYI